MSKRLILRTQIIKYFTSRYFWHLALQPVPPGSVVFSLVVSFQVFVFCVLQPVPPVHSFSLWLFLLLLSTVYSQCGLSLQVFLVFNLQPMSLPSSLVFSLVVFASLVYCLFPARKNNWRCTQLNSQPPPTRMIDAALLTIQHRKIR